MDCGFNDYKLFAKWCREGVYFVRMMKEGAVFEIVEHREPPRNRNVIMDNIIRLTGFYSAKDCLFLLRHAVVHDPEKDEDIVF